MSSESLRVLEAEPIDVNYDSDLDIASPDASTALLQDYPESREEPSPSSSSPPRHRHYVRVIALSLVAAIFIEVGDYMERAPMMRVIEDILCRKYYESTAPLGTHITLPIPEQECKIPAVQGELAMLKGWDAALACIPGLLLALPYGYIADRYGRKIVLLLSLIGVTLGLAWILLVVLLQAVLDVRWIWAGNAFLCIGGGASVIRATIYAIFADVTPENKRAAVFFQFNGAVMLSPVIGVPLSWYIMKTSSILAMEVGLASVFCGLLLIFFLPETLDQAKATEAAAHATSGDSLPQGDDMAQPSKMLTIYGVIKGSNFVFAIPVLRTLLITFVIGPVLMTSMSFLVQFASDKYHWSIADASFISPFSAITTLIMLVVILPLIYSLLGSRLGFRPAMRDLVVARGSLIFLVLGCLIIGLAPSPGFLIAGIGILSLGVGSVPAIRSLVTSFVHADQVSRLYGVLAVIETIGSLVLNPLFSKSFSWGMSLGGVWSGMVFILAGVITAILSLPVYIVRPPKPEEDIHA